MSPAQTKTAEWTAEEFLDKPQTTNDKFTIPQAQAKQLNKPMVKSAGRRSLPQFSLS